MVIINSEKSRLKEKNSSHTKINTKRIFTNALHKWGFSRGFQTVFFCALIYFEHMFWLWSLRSLNENNCFLFFLYFFRHMFHRILIYSQQGNPSPQHPIYLRFTRVKNHRPTTKQTLSFAMQKHFLFLLHPGENDTVDVVVVVKSIDKKNCNMRFHVGLWKTFQNFHHRFYMMALWNSLRINHKVKW